MGNCLGCQGQPRHPSDGAVKRVSSGKAPGSSKWDVSAAARLSPVVPPGAVLHPSAWLALPHDVLGQVCDLLDADDLAALALTCSDWRRALHAALAALQPAALPPCNALAAFSGLQALDLTPCAGQVTDATLAQLAPLRALTSLSLAGCRRLTGRGLSSLLACEQLSELDLSDCASLLDVGLEAAASLAHLRTLVLQDNESITKDGLARIVARCSRLQALTLHGLRGATNELLTQLPSGALSSSLSRLELRAAWNDVPSVGTLGALARLPALRALSLVKLSSRPAPADTLELLGALGTLRALQLDVAVARHRQGLAALLQSLTQLESLKLGRSLALHEEDLALLAPHTHLTTLRLHLQRPEGYDPDCTALEGLTRLQACELTLWGLRFDQTVPLLVASLPASVTHLAITEHTTAGCQALPDDTAAAWQGVSLARLSRLQKLTAQCGDGLSQDILDSAFTAAGLRELTLCSSSPPAGGAPLRFAGLTALCTLSRLAVVSPEGVGTELLEACGRLPQLESLELQCNHAPKSGGGLAGWRLDARALSPLAAPPRLHHLRVFNASTLTRAGSEQLGRLAALRTLRLLHCNAVKLEALTGALAGLHRLRELVVHGRGLVPSRKALDALAPLTNLTYLSLMDPYYLQKATAGMVTWSKKGDPYHLVTSELTPEYLKRFLEAHPVLAHYEFLRNAPNSNGVYGVKWVGRQVEIGSMWTSD